MSPYMACDSEERRKSSSLSARLGLYYVVTADFCVIVSIEIFCVWFHGKGRIQDLPLFDPLICMGTWNEIIFLLKLKVPHFVHTIDVHEFVLGTCFTPVLALVSIWKQNRLIGPALYFLRGIIMKTTVASRYQCHKVVDADVRINDWHSVSGRLWDRTPQSWSHRRSGEHSSVKLYVFGKLHRRTQRLEGSNAQIVLVPTRGSVQTTPDDCHKGNGRRSDLSNILYSGNIRQLCLIAANMLEQIKEWRKLKL